MDLHPYPHSAEKEEIIIALETDPDRGLSWEEVRRRQAEFGPNALPRKKSYGLLGTFFGQFTNPLIYLLFLAAAAMFLLGRTTDPFVVLGVVVINAIMGTFQEGRAARSLNALRKLAALKTRVLRNGQEEMIESSLLVPGDIIYLAAGDSVPADARLIEIARLQVVEAALTGEAHPIAKCIDQLEETTVLAERRNMLFSGTHLSSGRCVAIVTAIGRGTELGKIAELAESGAAPKTPIERRIDEFGTHLGIAAVVMFFLFFGIGLLRGLPTADMILAAVSQLVSLIPEGLPAAITIALAVGVQRMVAHGAIVRRLAAVETLGSTTVICSDKTGTLTQGEMTVKELYLPGQLMLHLEGNGYVVEGRFLRQGQPIKPWEIPALLEFLETSSLCNDAKLEGNGSIWRILGDPTEAALLVASKKAGINIEELQERYQRIEEIPFDSSHKMMATAHASKGQHLIAIKGAIESVIDLCSEVRVAGESIEMNDRLRREILHEAESSAAHGLRILAVASITGGEIDPKKSFMQFRGKACFLGFVGEMDPPRAGVHEAVKICRRAGIRPMMITGDHRATAAAIARQIGILHHADLIIEGHQLEMMPDQELSEKIDHIAVFCRVHPAQKLRIVQTLQKKGEIVAMTGDGINDAPALAKADVGVAMGITGTDVAKEAAKVVITDDNFSTIVKAVEQGRLVYQNIKKVIFYLLSTTVAAVLLMVIAVSLGYPLPIAAVQVLWINVITEGTVTINLVLDPPEGNEMRRLPTRVKDHILSGEAFWRLLYITPIITSILFIYFLIHFRRGAPLPEIQTQVFTLLAFCAWFKVISARSEVNSSLNLAFLQNRYLTIGLLASMILQAAVIYIPPLSKIFHTVPLSFHQVVVLLALGSIVMWVEEFRKWIMRRNLP